MTELLEVAFQASLLSEEGRPLQFRLAYCQQEDLKGDLKARRRNTPIPFTATRQLTVSELVRLAPAADPRQCLIGVGSTPTGALEIWGIIDAGLSWWEFARGERSGSLGGSPPPDCLTVASAQRGALSVSRAGLIICSLERGSIVLPTPHVFETGPFGELISGIGQRFHGDVLAALQAERYDPEGHDEDVPERMLMEFLRRILDRIRDNRHGGTLLIVPDEWTLTDSRLRDRLRPKYPLADTRPWTLLVEAARLHREYFDLLLPAYDKESLTGSEFRRIQVLGHQREDVEDLIRDCAGLIASLTSVDGAVVITTKLQVLGFGCEVIAQSPALTEIAVAADAAAEDVTIKGIDELGTRHRSALRFCSSHEDVAAIIVSQDGDIRAARRVGPDVVLWTGVDVRTFAV
jgi:hypothetical protein